MQPRPDGPGAALFTALAVLAALALAACGSNSTAATTTGHGGRSSTHAHVSRTAARPVRPASFAYHAHYKLPAPVRDPAFATLGGGRFVLLGGLDAADVSTAGIEVANARTVLRTANIPVAQHDAQAARLAGKVYVFGGGTTVELDHVIAFDPASAAVRTVGALPRGQSDVAVTSVGNTAYVVGGYDGTSWLNTILAWRPGDSTARVVGHLPVGLRYATATAVAGKVVIAGGSTPTAASNEIYRFDPATGRVQTIGRLPQPITHGAAATLGSFAYLVGGRGNGDTSQTAGVWSINPRTGRVHPAGHLPEPLSDTAVLPVGGALVVAGGLSSTGAVSSSVGELVPR